MTTTLSMYNMLIEDTTARLIDQLITNVSDDTKLTLVLPGLGKNLPTDSRIAIEVRTGDEQWRHTLNISAENVGAKAPFGAIGGILFWRERFVVGLELYFPTSLSQDESRAIASVILSRARWSLQNQNLDQTWWLRTTADDFGEKASQVQVLNAFMIEGGSTNKWTWRGEIRIEFITENEGCV